MIQQFKGVIRASVKQKSYKDITNICDDVIREINKTGSGSLVASVDTDNQADLNKSPNKRPLLQDINSYKVSGPAGNSPTMNSNIESIEG